MAHFQALLLMSLVALAGEPREAEAGGPAGTASPRPAPEPPPRVTTNQAGTATFIQLRDRRAELDRTIIEQQRDLDAGREKARSATDMLIELETLISRLKTSEGEQKAFLEARSAFLDRELKIIGRGKLPDRSTLEQDVGDRERLLLASKSEKDRIEAKISELLSLELAVQGFKTSMSIAFTILVGLVILGFFLVATVDQKVRQRIFSGQAGIQFVTLFSIVIAIILFGITNVLEGKELSALIGGLSGYILGRAQQDPAEPQDEPGGTK
jgi:hypothetical protein